MRKVDGGIPADLSKAAQAAKDVEAAGYSGAWTAETAHDPFLPLAVAAEHTERIELGTSIAVAFARNPMLLANLGWDLQAFSKGRFVLGLGSQIKPHIEKRFSMEWSHPAARMREMIMAIRAIWDTWENGSPLNFRGDFYTHTLMTPFFTPDRADLAGFGTPKIFLAGVGELMTEVAGEVCDGFICHGFTTEKYLREVTLPALQRGRAKAGKTMEGFEVVGPSF
ncbi:MAG: TIGR03617 family F420-dependent LLM class oxidoreductase, partial [Actinomycetota bacterium]